MSTSRIDLNRIKALEDAVEALSQAVATLQADKQQAQQNRTPPMPPGISRNPKRSEYA